MGNGRVLKLTMLWRTGGSALSCARMIEDPKAGGNRAAWWERARVWVKQVLLLALVFSPAVYTATLVSRYAVNITTWDDWEMVKHLESMEAGTLSLEELNSPHIGHRMLFPRLAMLALAKVFQGDIRAQMGLIYVIITLTGVGLFVLVRRTLGAGSRLVYPVALAINVLVFSPLQWQNLLWGIQVAFVFPLACIVWALVVLGWTGRRARPAVKFVLCLVLALVATHSFGHGILIWPVVLLASLLGGWLGGFRRRAVFAGWWLGCFVAVAMAYYNPETYLNSSHPTHAYNVDYGQPPPGVSRYRLSFENPEKLVKYFLGALGSGFSREEEADPEELARAIGTVLLVLLAAGSLYWMMRWRDERFAEAALPWLALAGTAVAACWLVSMARSPGYGLYRALSPRYISMALYLPVGIIGVGVLAVRQLVGRASSPVPRALARDSGLVLLTLFLAHQGLCYAYGHHAMKIHHAARLHAKTSLVFINYFEPDRIERLDSSYEFLREQANRLDALGYLEPPLATSLALSQFKISGKTASLSRGGFESFEPAEDGGFLARGYAELPGDAALYANGVFLVALRPGQSVKDAQILTIAEIQALPEMFFYFHDFEFDAVNEFGEHAFCQWEKLLSLEDLPADEPSVLRAYAVDIGDNKLYRLPGGFRFDPANGAITPAGEK